MFETGSFRSSRIVYMDLIPAEPNDRGGRTSSWKISNKYRPIYLWNTLSESDPLS